MILMMLLQDRECVDDLLGLESAKLKFAKRKLRVQRCKVVPSSIGLPSERRAVPAVPPRAKKSAATTITAPLPKGDPSLGEKLASLSKDERKAAKAANADRIKRRLAKKKIKEGVQKAHGSKERRRERTRLINNKSGGSTKGRVRSERHAAKRNAKK
jgi:nucleolar protein 12